MSGLTGGAAVVDALREHGVDVVFGIPGTHNLEIYRYLVDYGIRHVTPRHEQGAGYAADGYARVTGRFGVVITTSGPGLTNATTAAATSYADSIPVLLISPGVPRGLERADIGWLHDVKDQHAHLEALVERSVRVADADAIAPAIRQVVTDWRRGRPRPVHLEIPVDVLEGPWTGPDQSRPLASTPASTAPVEFDGMVLDSAALGRAADMLAGARRPAVLFGGGARDAARSARVFAELLDAVVVTTVNGKGVVPEWHPLSLGAAIRLAPAQQALSAADVLVVVGSEVGDSDLWGGALTPSGTVIRIDISPAQLTKNLRPDIGILGDATEVLNGLIERLRGRTPWSGGGADEGAGIRRAARARTAVQVAARADGLAWQAVQDVLRAELPDDVIVAGDSAQVSYYGTVHFWPMKEPRRFLYPTGFATLGYGLPAAMGAKIACPDRTVLVLVGDGGFQFTAMELVAAAAEHLQLIVVIMNNGGFAEIREGQLARGIDPIAVDIPGPDFAALARACGCVGVTLRGLDGLDLAVRQARNVSVPTVIDVRMNGPMTRP